MRFRHDPLAPQPRQKKPRETPDETERRLNADLRLLMNDKRYRENDPDYIRFVQRQFRRVYDDPSGEPSKDLRIGRPQTFATSLEPFDRAREQRLRRESKTGVPEGVRTKTMLGQSLSQDDHVTAISKHEHTQTGNRKVRPARLSRDRQVDSDENDVIENTQEKLPTQERSYPFGGNAGRSPQLQRKKRIEQITVGVEGMIAAAEERGLSMAPTYLQRYLDGVGGVVRLDWSAVRSHGPAAKAEMRIREHYVNWFMLDLDDETIGAPFMALKDGDVLEIGEAREGSTVMWEGKFKPVFSGDDLDASLVFGTGNIIGYGKMRFERHGDEISVSGIVSFDLDEPYDFEEFGFKTLFISTFKSDGPTINNYNLKYLAQHGPAAEYRIQARHFAEVTGTIVLRDGKPDPELSTFTWRDFVRNAS